MKHSLRVTVPTILVSENKAPPPATYYLFRNNSIVKPSYIHGLPHDDLVPDVPVAGQEGDHAGHLLHGSNPAQLNWVEGGIGKFNMFQHFVFSVFSAFLGENFDLDFRLPLITSDLVFFFN